MTHDLSAPLPGTLVLNAHATPVQFATAVAAAVRQAVVGAVRERGHATLVVPGGTTPRDYYPLIAALDVPWDRVTITLSDERQVPGDHPDSNERLLRECLLRDRAAAARFVPLYRATDPDPLAGAIARIAALPRPFDLVILGLGADAHVASLFPGSDGVGVALDPTTAAPVCELTPPAGASPALPRLSLSMAALLDSRRIVIATRGLDKRTVLERAARGDWPMPSPVRALALHARQPVDVCWCGT